MPGTVGNPSGPRDTAARRALFGFLGGVCVALGTAGVFLPILPTTPFMILAAACFARSSRRAHRWLLRHRVFGPTIRQWQRSRTIPARAKAAAISLIVLTIGTSMIIVGRMWLCIMLAVIGLSVIGWLLSIPTTAPPRRAEPRPGARRDAAPPTDDSDESERQFTNQS